MTYQNAIGARQIRAARALLDWSQEDLAGTSGLSVNTIRKIEMGHISPRNLTTNVIRQAIENAGLEFIDPEGIRRRHDDITVYQGLAELNDFLEDIQQTVKNTADEIAVVVGANSNLFLSDNMNKHCDKFTQILNAYKGITIKCLLSDVSSIPLCMSGFESRSISKRYIDPVPFYIYGSNHAMVVPGDRSSFRIIVLRSLLAAKTARRQFFSMWDMATPMK